MSCGPEAVQSICIILLPLSAKGREKERNRKKELHNAYSMHNDFHDFHLKRSRPLGIIISLIQ
jgi:hypothetical protein